MFSKGRPSLKMMVGNLTNFFICDKSTLYICFCMATVFHKLPFLSGYLSEIKNASAKVAKSEPKQNQITEELTRQTSSAELDGSPVLKFSPVSMLEDVQAVRAVSFHPGGKLFAVGSNSKVLRICSISSLDPIVDEAG